MLRNKLKNLLIILGLIVTSDPAITQSKNVLYLFGKNKDFPKLNFDNYYHKKFFLAQTELNWEYFEEENDKKKFFGKN